MMPSLKFSKEARLRKSLDYQKVLKKGKKRDHPLLKSFFLPGPETRLGWIVRAQAASAIHRNRIKRILRETFRRVRASLPSGDYVVFVKEGAGKVRNKEICNALKELLKCSF